MHTTGELNRNPIHHCREDRTNSGRSLRPNDHSDKSHRHYRFQILGRGPLFVKRAPGRHPYTNIFDAIIPLLMPLQHPTHFRNLENIEPATEYIRPIDVAKKKKRHYTPPSGQPVSRFPACQFALPETLGALWGRAPPHGKFYRGHARYACHAHHAKRQVYQPGLSPLSRAGLY